MQLNNGIEMNENKKSNTVIDVEAETNNNNVEDSGVVSIGNVSARKWKISTMVVVFMAVTAFVTIAVVGSVGLAQAKAARRAVEDYRQTLQTKDQPQDRVLHGQVAPEETTTTPWEKAPRLGHVARRDQSCRYKRAIGWGSSVYNANYGCLTALGYSACGCWVSATYTTYSYSRRRYEVVCYVGTTGPIDTFFGYC
jgi:hypothetical protein